LEALVQPCPDIARRWRLDQLAILFGRDWRGRRPPAPFDLPSIDLRQLMAAKLADLGPRQRLAGDREAGEALVRGQTLGQAVDLLAQLAPQIVETFVPNSLGR